MSTNYFRKISFLIVSLVLVCCTHKSFTPLNAVDVNTELNSGQPGLKVDNATGEKPPAVPLPQSVEFKKEVNPAPENVSIALNVQFDTGKANIKPEYHNHIKGIAEFMSKYPATSAVIEGHSDNIGKEALIVKLSYRRAANIKAYLIEKFGVDSSRIRAIGYDYQKPIASNKTSEGRQKNRRGEARIEAKAPQDSSYSFFEDSDLPKGGFSVVNQETIDAKIASFKEKKGVASYFSKIVGPTLELYTMWGGIFSHCAIRIETDPHSFYQLELQTLTDLKKVGMKDYNKIGAVITLLGVTADQFDVVEFTDKDEREKLDNKEPNYATMPICIEKKATKKTTQW